MRILQSLRIVAATSILFTASLALGQSTLIDDFQDGNLQGWRLIDANVNSHSNLGLGTFSASTGALEIKGSEPTPEGQRGVLMTVWDESAAPKYQDGLLRAKFTVQSNTLAWLALRANETGSDFYLFGADPSGITPSFFFNRIADNRVADFSEVPFNEAFKIGEEWNLEAGAVGSDLSMKVWRTGTAEPAAPQWTHVDDSLETGRFGVGASHWDTQPAAVVWAKFDDVTFQSVPEPGSLSLMALAGLSIFLRRGKTPSV